MPSSTWFRQAMQQTPLVLNTPRSNRSACKSASTARKKSARRALSTEDLMIHVAAVSASGGAKVANFDTQRATFDVTGNGSQAVVAWEFLPQDVCQ